MVWFVARFFAHYGYFIRKFMGFGCTDFTERVSEVLRAELCWAMRNEMIGMSRGLLGASRERVIWAWNVFDFDTNIV